MRNERGKKIITKPTLYYVGATLRKQKNFWKFLVIENGPKNISSTVKHAKAHQAMFFKSITVY